MLRANDLIKREKVAMIFGTFNIGYSYHEKNTTYSAKILFNEINREALRVKKRSFDVPWDKKYISSYPG